MGSADRKIRIAASLVLILGVMMAALALLSDQLGVGEEAARGMFGWKRIALLIAGALVAGVGAVLAARPQIVSARVSWERIRAHPAFGLLPAPLMVAVVGVPFGLVGAAAVLGCSPGARCSDTRVLGGSLLTVGAAQLVMVGLLAQAYASVRSRAEVGSWSPLGERVALGTAFLVSLSAAVAAFAASLALTDRWLPEGIGGLASTRVIGVLGLALATQLVIASGLLVAAAIAAGWRGRVRGARTGDVVGAVAGWLRSPPGIVTLLTVAFIVISYWWIAADTRPPTDDAVRNLGRAAADQSRIEIGELTRALTEGNRPGEMPLLYLIGAITMLFSGGLGVLWPTLTLNLIFVPVLAFATYSAASIAWQDRRAGVLAVMFVFAAPLVMSQSRVFMVDVPLAAMTALMVWLVLASDRFGRLSYTLAAGVALGLGVLTKSIFPFFVVGLLAIVLLRGGWRNWRNLAWIVVPGAVIAIPWILLNWTELWEHVRVHIEATEGWAIPGYQFPNRWSLENFTYYAWTIVNHQLLVPLTALFLIGIGVAARDSVKRWRDRASYAPELLAGLLAGYFLTTLLPLNDSRYVLPLVAYAAILGTGWMLRLERRPRLAAIGIVAIILAVNTTVQNLRIGQQVKVTVAEESNAVALQRTGKGTLVILSPQGFGGLGAPDRSARTWEIVDEALDQGVRRVSALEGGGGIFQHVFFVLDAKGVPGVEDLGRLGPDEMVIKTVDPTDPRPEGEPCTTWRNGTEHYIYRGDSRRLPAGEYEPWCPL